jgi:hypothetical protein
MKKLIFFPKTTITTSCATSTVFQCSSAIALRPHTMGSTSLLMLLSLQNKKATYHNHNHCNSLTSHKRNAGLLDPCIKNNFSNQACLCWPPNELHLLNNVEHMDKVCLVWLLLLRKPPRAYKPHHRLHRTR